MPERNQKIGSKLSSLWAFFQKPVTLKTVFPVETKVRSSAASSFSVASEEQLLASLMKSQWAPETSRFVAENLKPYFRWIRLFFRRLYAVALILQFPSGLMKNMLKKQIFPQVGFYLKRFFVLLLIGFASIAFVGMYQISAYLEQHGLKLDDLGEAVFNGALVFFGVVLLLGVVLSKWLRKREAAYREILLTYREIIRLRSGLRRRVQVDGDITPEHVRAYQEFLRKKQLFLMDHPDKVTMELANQYAETWDLERLKHVMEEGFYSPEIEKLLKKWPKIDFYRKPDPKLKALFYEDLNRVIRAGIEDSMDEELSYCDKMLDAKAWREFLEDARKAAHKLGHPLPQGYEHIVRDFFSSRELPTSALRLLRHLGISASEASIQPRVFMSLFRN